MEGFFTNTWVVSIITGIIVYGLTKIWEGFKNKKAYNNKLELANNEVFSSLKIMIPEDVLPTLDVFYSIHRSTAKKYKVKEKDMNDLPVIIDDLIKEVMDTNFLSYGDKLLYVDKLLNIIGEIYEENPEFNWDVPKELINNEYYNYRKVSPAVPLSITLFALSALAIIFINFFRQEELLNTVSGILQSSNDDILSYIGIVIGAGTGLTVAILTNLSAIKKERRLNTLNALIEYRKNIKKISNDDSKK